MNSVLFVIVTALALYQVSACKVIMLQSGSTCGSPTKSILIDDTGDAVETTVKNDLQELGLNIAYYQDKKWEEIMINDLCEDDPEMDVFKKISNGALGFDTCIILKGDYKAEKEIEYPDNVCSEISEKTNGNSKNLIMQFTSDGMSILYLTLKVED